MHLLCLSAIDVSCIVITIAMVVIVYMVASTHDTILTSIIDIYGLLEINSRTQRTMDEPCADELKKEIEELKLALEKSSAVSQRVQ